MIRLSRLNSKEFILNAEMIQFAEATPDTVITLSNGEKVVVKETVDQVIERVLEYRRGLRLFPEP
jgi:flagellar protein FlbD